MENNIDDRPIAKILGNGMIKYFNSDGSRNESHPIGADYIDSERILKQDGYRVIFIH